MNSDPRARQPDDQRPPLAAFLLVSDRADRSIDLYEALKAAAFVQVRRPDELQADKGTYRRIVVDINLADLSSVLMLRRKLDTAGLGGVPRHFVVDSDLHHGSTQARALGATSIMTRPLQADALLGPIRLSNAGQFRDLLSGNDEPVPRGMARAHDLMMQMFEGIVSGDGPTFQDVVAHEQEIVEALHHANLQRWIDIVRHHHNHSYRHCLLVTGFAVAFGSYLGFGNADKLRLARAALLHDVGKAFTPISILDKPGKLTPAEMVIMRRHPQDGHDYLENQGGFPAEVLDVALSHHEMLDGTGYPRQLAGSQICDLVRIITVADIYAALSEDRPYRAALSRERAFSILSGMGQQLDVPLVREFGRMVNRLP